MAEESCLKNPDHGTSSEEDDLLQRSWKKVKNAERLPEHSDEDMRDEQTHQVVTENPWQKPKKMEMSYKEKLLRPNGCNDESYSADEGCPAEDSSEEEEMDLQGEDEEENQVNALCPDIKITVDEWRELCKPWKLSLVVKLLGRTLGFRFIRTRLQKLWQKEGLIDCIDIGNECFLIRFTDLRDYNFALTEGPWVISNHYLMIQRWFLNFDPFTTEFNKIPIWIRVPGLPIVCYNKHFLWKLGNNFGKTLKVDPHTLSDNPEGSAVERGKFARICIEIDLRKQLITKYKLRGKIRQVQYEGLRIVCFHCGIYGHHKDHCPSLVHQEQASILEDDVKARQELQDQKISSNTQPEVGESDFGPWMMVQRQKKKTSSNQMENEGPNKTITPENSSGKSGLIPHTLRPRTTGSRFNVLGETEMHSSEREEAYMGEKQQDTQAMEIDKTVLPTTKKGKKTMQNKAEPSGLQNFQRKQLNEESTRNKGSENPPAPHNKGRSSVTKTTTQKETVSKDKMNGASSSNSPINKENIPPQTSATDKALANSLKPPDPSSLEVLKWAQQNMSQVDGDAILANLGATRVEYHLV